MTEYEQGIQRYYADKQAQEIREWEAGKEQRKAEHEYYKRVQAAKAERAVAREEAQLAKDREFRKAMGYDD